MALTVASAHAIRHAIIRAARARPESMTSHRVLAYPAFVRLWISDVVADLGSFTSALALQYVVIETLQEDQQVLGIVRSAQWLPSLLLGMVVGVIVDRIRRRHAIVTAHVASAAGLGMIAAFALSGHLTVALLVGLVVVVGLASVVFHAAHQSYVPRLVPMSFLPTASARLEQTMTAAQSIGPLIAGAFIRFLSAPIAIVINAVAFVISAATVATIKHEEPQPTTTEKRHLWPELREGARWVYRHPTLAPYAIWLHVWFFFNSTIMTVFVFYADRELGIDALRVGAILACAGATGVLGAGLAPRLAQRLGAGWVCIIADWLVAVSFVPVVLAQPGTVGVLMLVGGQLVYGLGLGLRGPIEGS